MAAESSLVEVFSLDNVSMSIHPQKNERIPGKIRLIRSRDASVFLTWIPKTTKSAGESKAAVETAAKAGHIIESNLYSIRATSISEIKSITKSSPKIGSQYIIIVLNSGLSFHPLYFQSGGVKEFINRVSEHCLLISSKNDPNHFTVLHPKQQPSHSAALANAILPCRNDSSVAPPSPSPAPKELPGSFQESRPRSSAFLSASSHFLRRRDFLYSGLGLRALRSLSLLPAGAPNDREEVSGKLSRFELRSEFRAAPTALLGGSVFDQYFPAPPSYAEESRTESTAMGDFEILERTENAAAEFDWSRKRPPPLAREEFLTFMDSKGRIGDFPELRRRIFHGGCHHSIRREAWQFLLGVHSAGSTFPEREEGTAAKRRRYREIKAQWQTISEEQEKQFSGFRDRKHRIEKDVVRPCVSLSPLFAIHGCHLPGWLQVRTDRRLPFYAGEGNANVASLKNILISYSFFNFDLGYCQGMSDMLSPIFYVTRDEADAFWCFVKLMETMADCFSEAQPGIHRQLSALERILGALDPELRAYLESKDCLNFHFCFRWLLVRFKREFVFDGVLRLWDSFWTAEPPDFHLFFCAAVLIRQRRCIMDQELGFESLVRFVNDLSGKIDLDATLRDAEALCWHFSHSGEAG